MSLERRPAIIGMGKARGSREITRQQTARTLEEIGKEKNPDKYVSAAVHERLLRRVGIENRGWLNENEGASALGAEALKEAMEMAGVTVKDLKSLIVATGLPDYLGVPTGTIIAEKLGGNKNLQTVDVSGACPGFFHALKGVYESLSSTYGIGSPQACVAAEPASKGIDPAVSETYALFGDGGGAFVMSVEDVDRSAPPFTFEFGNDPSLREDLYVPAGGSRKKLDTRALEENLNCIRMNGEKVKKAAIYYMSEIAKKVLDKAGLTMKDINLVVPHQANLEIIRGVGKELVGAEDKVYVNIQRYGNTSAASVPIAMREAWEEGRLKRGDRVLAVSFGAGLNFAGAIMSMDVLPENL